MILATDQTITQLKQPENLLIKLYNKYKIFQKKKKKGEREKGEMLNLNIILKYIPQIAKNDFLLVNKED